MDNSGTVGIVFQNISSIEATCYGDVSILTVMVVVVRILLNPREGYYIC